MEKIGFLIMIVSALHSSLACAVTQSDNYGEAVPGQPAPRSLLLSPSTRYINVTNGDVLELVYNEHRIVWRFDGITSAFNLQEILPADLVDHRVMVYVNHLGDYR